MKEYWKRGKEEQTKLPVLKRHSHSLYSFSSNVTSFKIHVLKWGSVKAVEDLFWSSSTYFSRFVF